MAKSSGGSVAGLAPEVEAEIIRMLGAVWGQIQGDVPEMEGRGSLKNYVAGWMHEYSAHIETGYVDAHAAFAALPFSKRDKLAKLAASAYV